MNAAHFQLRLWVAACSGVMLLSVYPAITQRKSLGQTAQFVSELGWERQRGIAPEDVESLTCGPEIRDVAAGSGGEARCNAARRRGRTNGERESNPAFFLSLRRQFGPLHRSSPGSHTGLDYSASSLF